MEQTEQFPGQNVYQHGQSVNEWFTNLYDYLFHEGTLDVRWRLPEWIKDPHIVNNLLPKEVLDTYQIYHDIGKPLCLEIDAEGKRHFPNHADVSADVWIKHASTEDDKLIAELMRKDMLCHTAKGDAINELVKDPLLPSLLLTSMAEIHANASHLNALESDSFKIKLKHTTKIGKKFIAYKNQSLDQKP